MTDTVAADAVYPGSRLNTLLAEANLQPISVELAGRFADYVSLLLRWNLRMNLTAIRDEEGILARHFVESIACARAVPEGIGTLLDFGSGAGFPGIPISMCRPEISVCLAESQGKKAAFLREAVRVLEISARVHSQRAELLSLRFDCVTLRAVDRMIEAIETATAFICAGGWLAVMTTDDQLQPVSLAAGPEFIWDAPRRLGSRYGVLALGHRQFT